MKALIDEILPEEVLEEKSYDQVVKPDNRAKVLPLNEEINELVEDKPELDSWG